MDPEVSGGFYGVGYYLLSVVQEFVLKVFTTTTKGRAE